VRGVVVTGALLLASCTRPPVQDPNPQPAADAGPDAAPQVDLERFVVDDPAIGGGWYHYDVTNHSVAPREQSYVVQTATGFIAFRPTSYYDDTTGDSGRFTLDLSRFDGTAWAAPTTLVTSKNIKNDGPVCVDGSTFAETACTDAGATLVMRIQPRLVLDGPLVVADPGLFVRGVDGVTSSSPDTVATVEGTTDLTALPAPSTLQAFDSTAAHTPTSTHRWNIHTLATSLPTGGMAWGCPADDGKVRFALVARDRIVKLRMHDGVLDSAWAPFDADARTVGAFSTTTTTALATLGSGQVSFVALARAGVTFGDAQDAESLFVPPDEVAWDVALYARDDAALCVVLSSRVAVALPTVAEAAFDDAKLPTL
jgi:hypothetical protein